MSATIAGQTVRRSPSSRGTDGCADESWCNRSLGGDDGLLDALVEVSAVNETSLLEEFQEASDGHSIALGDEGEKAWVGGGLHDDVEGELIADPTWPCSFGETLESG